MSRNSENILPNDYTVEGLIDWRPIEQAMNEQTASGLKIAVIETQKMLEQIIKEKQFPGKTIEQQIRSVKKIMANPEQLEYSYSMYEQILHTPEFSLSLSDVKEIIGAYYQAIIDIREFAPRKKLGIIKRIRIMNRPVQQQKFGKLKTLFLALLFFIGITYGLANSTIGINITQEIVQIVNFIVQKILVIILAIAIFVGFILGIAQNVQKKKTRLTKNEQKSKAGTAIDEEDQNQQ